MGMEKGIFVGVACLALFNLIAIIMTSSYIYRSIFWKPHKGQIKGISSESSSESTTVMPIVEYEFEGQKYSDFDKKERHILKLFDGKQIDIFVNREDGSQYIVKKSPFGIIAVFLMIIFINAAVIYSTASK